jgi:hypothetical protein
MQTTRLDSYLFCTVVCTAEGSKDNLLDFCPHLLSQRHNHHENCMLNCNLDFLVFLSSFAFCCLPLGRKVILLWSPLGNGSIQFDCSSPWLMLVKVKSSMNPSYQSHELHRSTTCKLQVD